MKTAEDFLEDEGIDTTFSVIFSADLDCILKAMENYKKYKEKCECKVPEIVDLLTNPHCKKCGVKIK